MKRKTCHQTGWLGRDPTTDASRSFPVAAALCLLAGLAAVGCGGVPSLDVHVSSLPNTNEGTPVYVVVRRVSVDQFAVEGYDEASAVVFQSPADASVLRTEVIFPGRDFSMTIEGEQQEDLAVYFFFTRPGDRWAHPLPRPIPEAVRFSLGVEEIADVEVEE